jgi:hypothetical protein
MGFLSLVDSPDPPNYCSRPPRYLVRPSSRIQHRTSPPISVSSHSDDPMIAESPIRYSGDVVVSLSCPVAPCGGYVYAVRRRGRRGGRRCEGVFQDDVLVLFVCSVNVSKVDCNQIELVR